MDEHERELRRLRLEQREEGRDIEAAEAELAAAQMRLTDLLCDWAAQGRQVRFDTIDRPRRGSIVHVGDSVVTLLSDGDRREVIALRHVEGCEASSDGQVTTGWTLGHPRSLIAHLRGLVGNCQSVSIERRSSVSLEGVVIGAADSHVVLLRRSGGELAVPLEAIVSVSDPR